MAPVEFDGESPVAGNVDSRGEDRVALIRERRRRRVGELTNEPIVAVVVVALDVAARPTDLLAAQPAGGAVDQREAAPVGVTLADDAAVLVEAPGEPEPTSRGVHLDPAALVVGVHRQRVEVRVGQRRSPDGVIVEARHEPGRRGLLDDTALGVVDHRHRADAVGIGDRQDPAGAVDVVVLRRPGVVDSDESPVIVVREPRPTAVRGSDLDDSIALPAQVEGPTAVVLQPDEAAGAIPQRRRPDERTSHADEQAVTERPLLARVARAPAPAQHLRVLVDRFDSDVEVGAEPPASGRGRFDDQLHRVGTDVVEGAVDAHRASALGPRPPAGSEGRLPHAHGRVRPPERQHVEPRRHGEVSGVDEEVAGRRAHRVVDVSRILRHGADLRRRHRDLVGSGEIFEVDVALPGERLQGDVDRHRVDRDEAAVGVVRGDHGVVDQLDPGRDFAQLGDQAGHRRTDDRVTLRRAATTRRPAERSEGVVERVAIGLESIDGGCLAGVEGSQFGGSCLDVAHRNRILGCRVSRIGGVSRVSTPLGGESSPAGRRFRRPTMATLCNRKKR